MIEIYARLNRQPEHRREDEMADRLRSYRRSLRRREFERMLHAQSHKSSSPTVKEGVIAPTPALPNGRATVPPAPQKWPWLKSRAANFSKDLAHYMDFCLARLMVWRELRRQRKAGRRQ